MTNEESAFLAAILAEWPGRTVALIYADWLEDHGREEACFVRCCAGCDYLLPRVTRQGRLAWWDTIDERWLTRGNVGRVWLVKVWSWTPANRHGLYLTPSARGD